MSKVSLVCLSQPSAETDCHTAEELVAYAARVSNPSNQSNKKTAGKLVRYLIKENHWSPLEMVHITMEITTTRDISRQIIRHRSFSFQEFSQRYAKSETFTTRMARLQDPKNRQNSIELKGMDDFGKGGNKTTDVDVAGDGAPTAPGKSGVKGPGGTGVRFRPVKYREGGETLPAGPGRKSFAQGSSGRGPTASRGRTG